MLKVRQHRPDGNPCTLSIWRASVAAMHQFLSQEDREEIDSEAQAYLLSASLWVALKPRDQLVALSPSWVWVSGIWRHSLSIRGTGAKAFAGHWSPRGDFLSGPGHRGECPKRASLRLLSAPGFHAVIFYRKLIFSVRAVFGLHLLLLLARRLFSLLGQLKIIGGQHAKEARRHSVSGLLLC
jgi:hypothetical protein